MIQLDNIMNMDLISKLYIAEDKYKKVQEESALVKKDILKLKRLRREVINKLIDDFIKTGVSIPNESEQGSIFIISEENSNSVPRVEIRRISDIHTLYSYKLYKENGLYCIDDRKKVYQFSKSDIRYIISRLISVSPRTITFMERAILREQLYNNIISGEYNMMDTKSVVGTYKNISDDIEKLKKKEITIKSTIDYHEVDRIKRKTLKYVISLYFKYMCVNPLYLNIFDNSDICIIGTGDKKIKVLEEDKDIRIFVYHNNGVTNNHRVVLENALMVSNSSLLRKWNFELSFIQIDDLLVKLDSNYVKFKEKEYNR